MEQVDQLKIITRLQCRFKPRPEKPDDLRSAFSGQGSFSNLHRCVSPLVRRLARLFRAYRPVPASPRDETTLRCRPSVLMFLCALWAPAAGSSFHRAATEYSPDAQPPYAKIYFFALRLEMFQHISISHTGRWGRRSIRILAQQCGIEDARLNPPSGISCSCPPNGSTQRGFSGRDGYRL